MRSAVLANHYLVKAANLLRYYSFDLSVRDMELQLYDWLTTYPAPWIPAAVIEALYQGRYKTVSVEQILRFWQRRQQPQPLYGRDFEQLVCDRLPARLQSDQTVPLEVPPEKSAIAALAGLPGIDAPRGPVAGDSEGDSDPAIGGCGGGPSRGAVRSGERSGQTAGDGRIAGGDPGNHGKTFEYDSAVYAPGKRQGFTQQIKGIFVALGVNPPY
jgi:hypothetical protein